MSTISDPAKLKVVELRAELSSRGLDTKGNKAVLVKRLKDALEKELEKEIPDTSIADTSTEDLDTSVNKQEPEKPTATEVAKEPSPQPEPESKPEPVENAPEEKVKLEKMEIVEETKTVETVAEKPENDKVKVEIQEVIKTEAVKTEVQSGDDVESNEKKQEVAKEDVAENGETELQDQDSSELKNRKSRWGSVSESNTEPTNDDTSNDNENKKLDENTDGNMEQKGDKRKRSSASPERIQRRRSKSPIKEDEPPIDSDKVQLSWYDCDLHLQIDKNSFLSAQPYHDGAFGLIWSGVRTTHGVNAGKVCYEVKITETLKWEDIVRQTDRTRKDKNGGKGKKVEDVSNKEEKNNEQGESKTADKSEDDLKMNVDSNENKNEETGHTENTDVEMKEVGEENDAKTDEKAINQSEDVTGHRKEEAEEKETEQEQEAVPSHLCRVGWSLADTSLQLGEAKYSYAYESSGKFVTDKQFSDYGIKFDVGDVVGSYINIDLDEISITYTVNGTPQPIAIKIPRSELPDNFVFFPHVLSRNFAFELNVGNKEEPWFCHPELLTDYTFIEKAEGKVSGAARMEKRSDCEVIMMCGLPAAGKTYWVQNHVKNNPDKKYTIIGIDHLLERMTVGGNPIKNFYKKSWNVMMDKLQKSVNKLVEVAAFRRRNFIIDQTNIFSSAQRRKMRPFEGFKRRAVVVVVGDEEQAKRQALQEADGKDVPDHIGVLEMKGNMHIPRVNDCFEEVIFAELNEEESKAMVQKYIQQGRDAGFGPIPNVQRKDNRDDRSHRWHNRRNDNRGNYRDRNYYRYEHPRQGWHNRSGSWNRNDRRDTRGPPAPRDWRNNRGVILVSSVNNRQDSRSGNRDRSQGSYNRNRNQQPRSQQSWQSQGSWNQQGQGSWNQGNWHQGQGQGWSQQQQGWGSGGQGQWKYGQQQNYTQGYGNYPPNWNYYGQYQQNWSNTPQNQTSQAGQGTGQTTATGNGTQYGQYAQQAAWAQYAQQYAQGQNPNNATQPTQK